MIHSNNLTNENQNWEFQHPHFRRGAIDELKLIKRRSAKSRHHFQADSPSGHPTDNNPYLDQPFSKQISYLEERLDNMTQAYESLHKESLVMKTALSQQQEVNTKLR